MESGNLDCNRKEPPGIRQQYATRAVFFIGGFGAASWAPLVPFLKLRLQLSEDILGMLLLCIGFGSLLTMPFSGLAASRFGCRRVIVGAGTIYALLLLVLSQATSIELVMAALLLFGAVMGTIDVVANIHAVMVEKAAGRRLMSGMHALWSVGGFAGAGLFGFWLRQGFSSFAATACAVILMLLLLAVSQRGLLRYGGGREGTSLFAVPHGIVAFVGVICCIAFLVEGAIMDWGGVFLTTLCGVDLSMAGMGFAVFSAAMLVMRLTGDWLVQRFGGKTVVLAGGFFAVSGFLSVIFSTHESFIYMGFFSIGIGSANVVPIFFSLLGRQQAMPVNMAVSAVSTLGYLGILMGPAVIGFIAHATSLYVSFGILTFLLVLQTAVAGYVYKKIL